MATELETLRKRRDETMAQLETLVRDAGLELDVQRLASLTGQRQAAETVLQRLASQIANLERQEAERERAAALEKQRQAVDKATGPALRAFLEFQKRLAELQALSGDNNSEYWSGPKAKALQAEMRELIEAEQKLEARNR